MMTLVQAVKDFRAKQSSKASSEILLQKVTWDLDSNFVGQPLTTGFISRLSEYVDRKLEEYSAIYGSQAATRIALSDNSATQITDDHYAHDEDQDAFLRYADIDRRVNAVTGSVKKAKSTGVITEVAFDQTDCPETLTVERNLPETSDIVIPELFKDVSDQGEPSLHTGHLAIRLPGSNTKNVNHVTRCQDNSEETLGHRYFTEPNVYDQSWMNGGDLDAVVHTQGLLPEVPNRVKDSIIRPDPNQTSYVTPRLHKPKDTTSYVTSYHIDHRTLKITARVITADSSIKIDGETWFDLCDADGNPSPRNLKDVVRNTVKSNLTILMQEKNRTEHFNISETEQKALETLREMVTEEEFKKYLRYGFVPVKGKSGDTYQVFRNQAHTKVWRGGQVIEEICVRIHYAIKAPPTDNVIAFMTMISADEDEFKKMGNRYIMKKAV